MNLAEGMTIADRFRLQRELGRGGMGSVWLAHHTQLACPCAVKFIHAESANLADARARFEREARAAAHLRSVHVVAIMDYGVWEGQPYIAMEYLEGEDLQKRIARRGGRLSPIETVGILTQVARALTKAHGAGLVHRDLKPENIFLVREDDQEIAKVLDFGIAKADTRAVESSTRTGALLGTPFYMSPEQAQGTKGVDFRSDLWSLGVVAYRCITGQLPFHSNAFGDLLLQIMVNPMPVPTQVAPGVPPGFDAWWARAAARDPAHRFQSAKDLADSLAQSLGVTLGGGLTGPIGAGPETAHPRLPPSPVEHGSLARTPGSLVSLPTAAPAAKSKAPAIVVVLLAMALGVGLTLFAVTRRNADKTAGAGTSSVAPPTPVASTAEVAAPPPPITPAGEATNEPIAAVAPSTSQGKRGGPAPHTPPTAVVTAKPTVEPLKPPVPTAKPKDFGF